jgi:hypothetical protein
MNKNIWMASTCWMESYEGLKRDRLDDTTMNNYLLFELGSLSGIVHGGQVDWKNISLFQFAMFISIAEVISRRSSSGVLILHSWF